METISRKSKLWLPAWMVAGRYILLQTLNALAAWLLAVEKIWSDLTPWHYWVLATQLGIAALGALGAVMNGSWQRASEASKISPTKTTHES